MNLDALWSNMPIFFEDYGFTIDDLNETKKAYYVDFIKPDSSFWDTIWYHDVPVIDVKYDKYQFVLAPLAEDAEKTSVTILDAEGNALSAEVLEKIFPVMEAALSFRNVF
jgi:outer membrane protein assembly factor BamC